MEQGLRIFGWSSLLTEVSSFDSAVGLLVEAGPNLPSDERDVGDELNSDL